MSLSTSADVAVVVIVCGDHRACPLTLPLRHFLRSRCQGCCGQEATSLGLHLLQDPEPLQWVGKTNTSPSPFTGDPPLQVVHLHRLPSFIGNPPARNPPA